MVVVSEVLFFLLFVSDVVILSHMQGQLCDSESLCALRALLNFRFLLSRCFEHNWFWSLCFWNTTVTFYMVYQSHHIVENFSTNIAGLTSRPKVQFIWHPKPIELLILVHRKLYNLLWNIFVEKSTSGKHCLS